MHCFLFPSGSQFSKYGRQNYEYVCVFHIFIVLDPVQSECLTLSCETNWHSFKGMGILHKRALFHDITEYVTNNQNNVSDESPYPNVAY